MGIVGKIECELEARIGKAVHPARHDASTAHQAELEVVEMETVEIKKRLKDLKAQQSERETEARRFFSKRSAGRSLFSRGGLPASRRGPTPPRQKNR